MGEVLGVAPIVRDLHVVWGWVVVATNAVAGLWALGAHRWPVLRRRELWWFTGAAEIAIFVQVGIGAVLLQGRSTDDLRFHMFYGFVALFAVAIIYSYRAQLEEHLYLLYGFGGLFLMGLALRAIALNPG